MDQQAAVVLSVALAASPACCWLLLFHHLEGHPHLLEAADDVAFFAAERRRALIGVGVYAIAAAGVLFTALGRLVVWAVLPAVWAATSTGCGGP